MKNFFPFAGATTKNGILKASHLDIGRAIIGTQLRLAAGLESPSVVKHGEGILFQPIAKVLTAADVRVNAQSVNVRLAGQSVNNSARLGPRRRTETAPGLDEADNTV